MFISPSPSLESPRTPQSKHELPYEFFEDVNERYITEDGEQLALKIVVGGRGPVELHLDPDMDVENMQSRENAKEKEKEEKRKGRKFTSPRAQKGHVADGKTTAEMLSASPPENVLGISVTKTQLGSPAHYAALPSKPVSSGSLVNDEQADWNAMMVQRRKTRAKIASEAKSEVLKSALQVPKKSAVAPPVVSRVVAEVVFWVEEVDEKKGQMGMEKEREY
jgi:hypothetical protein